MLFLFLSLFLNVIRIMMAFFTVGHLLHLDIFKITKIGHFSTVVITLHDTKVGAYILRHDTSFIRRIVLIL